MVVVIEADGKYMYALGYGNIKYEDFWSFGINENGMFNFPINDQSHLRAHPKSKGAFGVNFETVDIAIWKINLLTHYPI